MARILWDGFDLYNGQLNEVTAKWDAEMFGSGGQFTTGDRFSLGQKFRSTSAGVYLKKTVSGQSHFVVGFALKIVSGATRVAPLFHFFDGTTKQITLTAELDGSFAIRAGTFNSTIRAQSAAAAVGAWHFIEVDLTIHASTGAVQIWKDGVSVVNVTSINTAPSGTAQATAFWLGSDSDASSGFDVSYDDFYLLDMSGAAPWNARLGDVRVRVQYPNAAGDLTQFTPSAGTNYSAVNETSENEDSTYNATSVVGNSDLFNIDDLPGGLSGTIFGIAHTTRWRKDDAGTRTASQVLKSGSTVVTETAVSLSSSYTSVSSFKDTDIDGSGAWAISKINSGLQPGYVLQS